MTEQTGKPLQPARSPLNVDTGDDLEKRMEAGQSLLMGSMEAPEPYKEEDCSSAIKLIFATSGEYPDGTKWERKATPDELAEYEKVCM